MQRFEEAPVSCIDDVSDGAELVEFFEIIEDAVEIVLRLPSARRGPFLIAENELREVVIDSRS